MENNKTSFFDILGLRKKLIENKDFLKIISSKSIKKRVQTLKRATKKQLQLLHTLLVAFVKGEIEISPLLHKRLIKSKKIHLLVKNFNTYKTSPQLLRILQSVSNILPVLIKHILKK